MENYDLGDTKRQELTEGQKPFAVVVTCSDSRVVPEYIFDQGLGDIFVIRVAGNVLDTDQIASIEYGVEHCGANLVVFLGHQSCGAVTAAVEAHEAQSEEVDSKNESINALINKIDPSVEAAVESGAVGDDLVDKAIDLNVEAGVQQLKEESQIISEGIESGEVQVIGAKYLLDSGEVTWFE
jgi:carbonic anhydrase